MIKIIFSVFVLLGISLAGCDFAGSDASFSTRRIEINSSLGNNDSIDAYLLPYRKKIDGTLNQILAYNKSELSAKDGALNSSLGNLMADLLLAQADPVFFKRSGRHIDFALLNRGGLRSGIPKGYVTERTAYEVMPFENRIVVLELTRNKVQAMARFLAKQNKAHPVSGIKLALDAGNEVKDFTVNNKPLKKPTYFVATIDYLMNGGNNMHFLKNPVSITDMDYLLRNAMIDYFRKTDTLSSRIDNRFIRE